ERDRSKPEPAAGDAPRDHLRQRPGAGRWLGLPVQLQRAVCQRLAGPSRCRAGCRLQLQRLVRSVQRHRRLRFDFGCGSRPGGGLNCGESTATCDVTLAGGSTVTLTASPAGRTRFMGWGGACSGTTTTCELTVNVDTKVTAEFQSEVMALAPSDGTNIYPVMA